MMNNTNRDWATDQQGTYGHDLIECKVSTLTASDKTLVTPEMLKAAQTKSELGAMVCAKYSGAYDLLTELYKVMHDAT